MEPLTGTRWKAKGFADIAQANPMSGIITELQASLSESQAHAMLSGCSDTLLEATPELADLLNRACFGKQINAYEKDKQWFQLGPEEAFYLHHALNCLTIIGQNGNAMNAMELWEFMASRRSTFPQLYKAYSHLRSKNWVVRSGLQYGVDFVAYRHHPALVHSEFAVLVVLDGEESRLRVWSDLQCSLRVCGGVAKTLLVLSVVKRNTELAALVPCWDEYAVIEERTITRWVPEQCREVHAPGDGGTE
ncbi:hypothetical protein J5N97_027237 [Dioscorea zingiberensis]|uniref:tRNA-intron lyase n=1 Tax=Dioscorea zingiberensis TaxID=325984 RepID=A0A9D5C4F9_9LILI|nr:hypothetical protein J5N97_027237 [Dioscorea zingiberensis]